MSNASLNIVVQGSGGPPSPLPPPGNPIKPVPPTNVPSTNVPSTPVPPTKVPPTPVPPPNGPPPNGPTTPLPLPPAYAASGGVGFLLPLAVTATALSAVFDTLIGTLKAFDDQAQEMVRRGSQWSGPVAAAAAMAEFKVSMAEFRRAMTMEKELTDYAEARSDLSVSIKELVTSISKDLLPVLTDLAKMSANGVDEIKDFREKMINSMAQQIIWAKHLSSGIFALDLDGVMEELDALREVMAVRNRPSGSMTDFINDIERFFDPVQSTQDFVNRGVTFADGRKL